MSDTRPLTLTGSSSPQKAARATRRACALKGAIVPAGSVSSACRSPKDCGSRRDRRKIASTSGSWSASSWMQPSCGCPCRLLGHAAEADELARGWGRVVGSSTPSSGNPRGHAGVRVEGCRARWRVPLRHGHAVRGATNVCKQGEAGRQAAGQLRARQQLVVVVDVQDDLGAVVDRVDVSKVFAPKVVPRQEAQDAVGQRLLRHRIEVHDFARSCWHLVGRRRLLVAHDHNAPATKRGTLRHGRRGRVDRGEDAPARTTLVVEHRSRSLPVAPESTAVVRSAGALRADQRPVAKTAPSTRRPAAQSSRDRSGPTLCMRRTLLLQGEIPDAIGPPTVAVLTILGGAHHARAHSPINPPCGGGPALRELGGGTVDSVHFGGSPVSQCYRSHTALTTLAG
eukprot:scaffold4882_cov70-Phaeocystis_antarctica.AAC.4